MTGLHVSQRNEEYRERLLALGLQATAAEYADEAKALQGGEVLTVSQERAVDMLAISQNVTRGSGYEHHLSRINRDRSYVLIQARDNAIARIRYVTLAELRRRFEMPWERELQPPVRAPGGIASADVTAARDVARP